MHTRKKYSFQFILNIWDACRIPQKLINKPFGEWNTVTLGVLQELKKSVRNIPCVLVAIPAFLVFRISG